MNPPTFLYNCTLTGALHRHIGGSQFRKGQSLTLWPNNPLVSKLKADPAWTLKQVSPPPERKAPSQSMRVEQLLAKAGRYLRDIFGNLATLSDEELVRAFEQLRDLQEDTDLMPPGFEERVCKVMKARHGFRPARMDEDDEPKEAPKTPDSGPPQQGTPSHAVEPDLPTAPESEGQESVSDVHPQEKAEPAPPTPLDQLKNYMEQERGSLPKLRAMMKAVGLSGEGTGGMNWEQLVRHASQLLEKL